ncbi:MAG: S-adenosylmethionine:tRNA ribosyltransferase-isomerase, partial [Candidatus Limnocylindria bacterium]
LAVEPAPPHRNVALRPGERLEAAGAQLGTVEGRRGDIPLLWRIRVDRPDVPLLYEAGEPIRYSYVPSAVPLGHYQTVFATRPGSAEPPSAGRAFTWELLLALRARGVALAEVLLHTGLSSYQDDEFDREHRLYEEWFEVGAAAVEAVRRAWRVVAVGTTVVRALETAGARGPLAPASGWTELRLGPDERPRVVDALLTGLHEPQASHWDMLRAFCDDELLERAYAAAVGERYLWHEFGDTMLIL